MPDTHWNNVSYLLHCNGSNGSTTFTDAKGNTFTANGDAQLSTTTPLYGTASGVTDGSGDYVSIGDQAAHQFGTGDFCIEFSINLDVADLANLLTIGSDFSIYVAGDDKLFFFTASANRIEGPVLSSGTKYDIALARVSGNTRMYVDGTQVGSTYSDSNNYAGGTFAMCGTSTQFDGKWDELRVTKGVGRYSGASYTRDLPHPEGSGFALTSDPGSVSVSGTAATLTAAQIARPSSDISLGSWTDNAGGTTNIYQKIDEIVADVSDYVKSANLSAGQSNTYDFHLSDVTDPGASTGHVVQYRYRKQNNVGTPQVNLTVSLRQGASTQIATNTHNNIGTDWVDGSFTLSGGEADAITDYTDLRLRFVAAVPA